MVKVYPTGFIFFPGEGMGRHLYEHLNTFQDYHAEGPGGVSLSHLDHTHYHGVVDGEPGSYVYGSVREGLVSFSIYS